MFNSTKAAENKTSLEQIVSVVQLWYTSLKWQRLADKTQDILFFLSTYCNIIVHWCQRVLKCTTLDTIVSARQLLKFDLKPYIRHHIHWPNKITCTFTLKHIQKIYILKRFQEM